MTSPPTRSAAERAQTKRFEDSYIRGQSPVLREIERKVCGCEYGGTSWTVRAEADLMARRLGLKPGVRLLEIGSGSGWPSLYLAEQSGCDLVLTDLPFSAVQIALGRAEQDQLPGHCAAAVVNAAAMSFADASFDAICHSDVLCCLVPKRAVLQACRQAIRREGKMVFSVIYLPDSLPPDDYPEAVEAGPEFIEAEANYETLLDETGWQVQEVHDLTEQFARSTRSMNREYAKQQKALEELIGPEGFTELQARVLRRATAAEAGLIKRGLFTATPRTG